MHLKIDHNTTAVFKKNLIYTDIHIDSKKKALLINQDYSFDVLRIISNSFIFLMNYLLQNDIANFSLKKIS